jgi:uncharacterized membrane protein
MKIASLQLASSRRLALVAGLLIALVAVGLRWLDFRDSLWLDELHTAWCVSGSWSDVAPRARIGNQSPFYFYLLRVIVEAGGLSELTLRLPSMMAGLALVGVAGFATFHWSGSPAAGLLAASLVAVDRNCIFYSQEARPYAILQLVAASHLLVVWQLAHRVTVTSRALFVLGAIVQFYLHYTSALFLTAEIVFLLDALLSRNRPESYSWRGLGLDLALIVAAALPAGWHLAEIGSRRSLWELFVKSPNLYDFLHTLRLDVYFLPCVGVFALSLLLHRGSKSIRTILGGRGCCRAESRL